MLKLVGNDYISFFVDIKIPETYEGESQLLSALNIVYKKSKDAVDPSDRGCKKVIHLNESHRDHPVTYIMRDDEPPTRWLSEIPRVSDRMADLAI